MLTAPWRFDSSPYSIFHVLYFNQALDYQVRHDWWLGVFSLAGCLINCPQKNSLPYYTKSPLCSL